MKAMISYCSLLLLGWLLCGLRPVTGVGGSDSPTQNDEMLIREKRDEEAQYTDENYWSGEQDRWPTFDELSKYSVTRKRQAKRGNYRLRSEDGGERIGRTDDLEGKVIYGTSRLGTRKRTLVPNTPEEDGEAISRRQSMDNSLYNLLSTKSQSVSRRGDVDNLKDLYLAAELLKKHREPRGLDNMTPNVELGHETDSYHPSEYSAQGNSTDEGVTILS